MGADLRHANLLGAHLRGANLSGAKLGGANLFTADLGWCYLFNSDLREANCRAADLGNARLRRATFAGANLVRANLWEADMSRADLTGADPSDAYVHGVNLSYAKLEGVILDQAFLAETIFNGVDLSGARGLTNVRHSGPSDISISTLYLSKGQIPEAFLRGCGVPEDFITYARSLTTKAIDFYSCFISYSSNDQEFAERLYADLQAKGVRVWFAPHDLPIGAKIRPAIDESIRLHDKLLLVLSEASVSSQWVEQEVETALAREREPEGKTVLFPIRVDDAIMQIKSGWPALLKNTRNVGDFTDWKDHDSYREAFDRLLRDLKAGRREAGV